MSFKSNVSENVIVEIEKPSLDEDKIIIEYYSNEESAKHMPTVAGTSSIQPTIISIDLDSDDGVSIRVLVSPPIHQRGKFYEKDIGINLSMVNTVAEQVLLQGIDALASIA